MAKKSDSSSDPTKEETLENSSSGEEDVSDDCSSENENITEYEKQRLSRIAHNKARLEALGLTKISASLSKKKPSNSVRDRKGKRKGKGKAKVFDDDDDDYIPNNEDDDHNDDDDDDNHQTPRSRKQKVNKKTPKARGVRKQLSSSDADEELMQAIALSLQDSPKGGSASKRKGKTSALEDTTSRRKKPFASRVQMSEDDVILHFFQFDEAGKGNITLRDLERVAIANDFIWSEKELADMINCFDNDMDGKINLSDFQKIVARLNMIRGSDNS
ncbi:hypothetical protein ACFE04_017466 [Oxalis oulophora]